MSLFAKIKEEASTWVTVGTKQLTQTVSSSLRTRTTPIFAGCPAIKYSLL
ncbi:hypothetical protein HU200_039439 [Digitaria exilis]|uniref:Uncharacterized protein n=1 Tax=Digitaria exilis TaxID=1010633 RepID=A0A835EFE4_9POAL|nr:hypothetical protein HU200_039439 [Digitaria exilis]